MSQAAANPTTSRRSFLTAAPVAVVALSTTAAAAFPITASPEWTALADEYYRLSDAAHDADERAANAALKIGDWNVIDLAAMNNVGPRDSFEEVARRVAMMETVNVAELWIKAEIAAADHHPAILRSLPYEIFAAAGRK